MDYCTQADIISRRLSMELLTQLTDPEGLGSPDPAIVAAAIAEATEIIDGYLRVRYPLPLPSVPGLVRNAAVDLSVYALYGHSSFATPERVKDDNSASHKVLAKLQSGTMRLFEDGSATAGAAETSPGMAIVTPARLFDQSTLERY